MIPCNFDSVTNRGTTGNCPAVPDEYTKMLTLKQSRGFIDHPARYMWDGSKLVEWPGWEQEEAVQIARLNADAIRADIAAQRYVMETSGIKYNGMTILTDRESVQILDSAIEKIRRGLVAEIEWKCPDGYLTLSTANISEIEVLVLSHVQAAFAWEKAEVSKL